MSDNNNHTRSESGSLEDIMNALADVIGGNIPRIQTQLDGMDNEMVVQTLFRLFTQTCLIGESLSMEISSICEGCNVVMAMIGYMMDYKNIDRRINTVYYSKLTPTGQLLRSPYHPLRLYEILSENGEDIPSSFQLLYQNQDYLPNIINIWDRGDPAMVSIITFKKVNVHSDVPTRQ